MDDEESHRWSFLECWGVALAVLTLVELFNGLRGDNRQELVLAGFHAAGSVIVLLIDSALKAHRRLRQ
jgi:hypothetical protein